jgi:hypothetical protein
MTTNPPTQNEEETSILGVTAEICEALKISFRPLAVTWMANLGHPSNLPSDQTGFIAKSPRQGRVVLPLALRGKLDLAEWRPLITSSLFFQFRPEIRRTWRVLGLLLQATFIVAFFAGPLVFSIFVILETNHAFGFEVYIVPLATFFLGLYFLMRFSFRFFNLHVVGGLRLKADRLSAQFPDANQFIQTLGKIDAMRIEDLEERKGDRHSIWKRGKVSTWPTITERLENLQGLSPRPKE